MQHLAQQGHEIIALVHDIDNQPIQLVANTMNVFGDIRNYKRLREILHDYKPDAILHLAAQAIVAQAQHDPLTTFDVNVNGTISLLHAWKHVCPSSFFLHFSTDKVYGNGLNKNELSPLAATDPYGTSKAAADLIAQNTLPNICITRSCNIYGPGDRNSRMIPNGIRALLKGERMKVFRGNLREYIYIDDLTRIVTQLVEARKLGIWNIGSGQTLTAEQVAEKIGVKYDLTESPEGVLSEQSLDTGKLCSELDCLSFTPFDVGIGRTLEWWKQEIKSHSSKPLTIPA